MAREKKPDVYCAWERKRFPAKEFEEQKGRGLVHVKGVTEPHTASGLAINGGGGGGGSGGWSAPADVPFDR